MNDVRRHLLIDNFDSFTYNLLHLVEGLGHRCDVVRNNELSGVETEQYSHLIVGPGPGLPKDSADLLGFIERWPNHKPLLGVCLGMQAMLELSGFEIRNINPVHHGAQDLISVAKGARLFAGLDSTIKVGRYHSWAFDARGWKSEFRIVAIDSNDLIMAVEHTQHPWFGVQFHPESIMTTSGREIMRNFLHMKNQ